MASHPLLRQTGVDPLAPIGELVHWLAVATAEVALGVVVGRMGARAMRRLNLHWAWALAGLVPVVTMHRTLAGAGPALAAATLAAAKRGRRWHRDDLQAGCDLAAAADRRLTPLGAFGRCVHALGHKCSIPRRAVSGGSGGKLALGHEAGGRQIGRAHV